jgi:ribosomal protein L16/L10AE
LLVCKKTRRGEAFRLAASKLPMKTQFIPREEQGA